MAKAVKYPRGELRGAVIDVMKKLRIGKNTTAETKAKAVDMVHKKLPRLSTANPEGQIRSNINFLIRNPELMGGKAVAAKKTKKSAKKVSARKAAPRKRAAKKQTNNDQAAA